MSTPLRQIARHGAVFGIGAIASRLASLVLLPLYTRHLTPSDYGIIALVDLVMNLAALVAGAGIATAALREHCARESPEHHDRVWWTALLFVGTTAAGAFGILFVARDGIARLAFGAEVNRGAEYLTIALSALWIGTVMSMLEVYHRAIKASTFLVLVGFGRLLLNVALNVWLVVGLHQGVSGILWGNLTTTAVTCVVYLIPFVRVRGPLTVDTALLAPYWRFGWPLIVFGLMSACMHEADRYLLRVFVSLHDVGLYSLGYQIGQGVNTLVVVPFTAIWGVVVYEVAKRPDAAAVYARVFRHFVLGLAFVLLGASLFSRSLIRLLAPPEYGAAADIVPIVCLAYLLFSLHEHFKVPAIISGRTIALLPVVGAAAAANVLMNVLLIPLMGPAGAAWATVGTFGLFSFCGLAIYRRIAVYPYPLRSCGLIVAAMGATYIAFRLLVGAMESRALEAAAATVVWCVWAIVLFGPVLLEHRIAIASVGRQYLGRRQAASGAVVATAMDSGRVPADRLDVADR